MKSLEQKIIVRCKNCGWRIFDKVTMTTGVIELKCPNCHRVVEVDLSLRKGTVKYRLARSNNRANNEITGRCTEPRVLERKLLSHQIAGR